MSITILKSRRTAAVHDLYHGPAQGRRDKENTIDTINKTSSLLLRNLKVLQ